VGVAAGQDHVHHLGLVAQGFGDDLRVEHVVADGVVDLVENDQVPLAGVDGRARLGPRLLDEADVFGIGFRAADLHEAAAHLFEYEVLTEGGGGVQLAVVPRAFDELEHQHFHAAAHGAQSGAERRGGLALAGPVLMRIKPRRESVMLAGSRLLSVLCGTGGP